MPTPTATDILQAVTVITKTGENAIGASGHQEIACGSFSFLTLFVDYVKGDETGLIIYPYVLRIPGGNEYPIAIWTTTAGVYVAVTQVWKLLATAKRTIAFDVRGIEYMKFYQGGSNNDGTPTGTLAASYTLDE